MPEEHLQTAFEIKTACDEISRRLLRWHWEQKPGAHSLDALLAHLAQRREESPVYCDRLPDLDGKTSWQQLDTTLCMRVLLDPEKDASRPLDLLGNTAHPAAARHACNAVRTARNEAAHAADRADAAQAALLFSEAIEALEDGYANSAFSEYELSRYYRQAEEFLARFSKKETAQAAKGPAEGRPAETPKPSERRKAAEPDAPAKKPRAQAAKNSERKSASAAKGKRPAAQKGKRKPQPRRTANWPLAIFFLLALLIGLALRAKSMGLI